jgi:hypothetical protein
VGRVVNAAATTVPFERLTPGRVEFVAHERAMRDVPSPTLDELLKYLGRRGPDGVLEAAGHLSDAQYARLVAAVAKRT